jgi:hypothetical protein
MPSTSTTIDLSTMTPVEVDTRLAAVLDNLRMARSRLEHARDTLRRTVKRHAPDLVPTSVFLQMTNEVAGREVIEENLMAEARPYMDEYLRRGTWPRAYLVTNVGGHIHRDMSCSTCRYDTSFYWLTEVSGQTEAEIVKQAGSDACTVCYPLAPVYDVKRPRSIFTPDEVQAKADREARAAAKVERDAKRLKAALLPDGSELRLVLDRYEERVSTLVTAKRLLTDGFYWSRKDTSTGDYLVLIAAIAAKEGKSTNQVIEEAKKRAVKRDR